MEEYVIDLDESFEKDSSVPSLAKKQSSYLISSNLLSNTEYVFSHYAKSSNPEQYSHGLENGANGGNGRGGNGRTVKREQEYLEKGQIEEEEEEEETVIYDEKIINNDYQINRVIETNEKNCNDSTSSNDLTSRNNLASSNNLTARDDLANRDNNGNLDDHHNLDDLIIAATEKYVKETTLGKEQRMNALEKRVPYHNSGLTVKYHHIDNAIILSIPLYEKKLKLEKIVSNSDYSLGKGCIGIYRHAYPRSKLLNFGYLEETRVITNISLFGEYLKLTLSPVVMISDEVDNKGKTFRLIHYVNRMIELILMNEDPPCQWVKLETKVLDSIIPNGGSTNRVKMWFQRGCSFDLCLFPKNRTFVYDGSFVEKNGMASNASTNGIIPAEFVRLYHEVLDKTLIPGLL